MSRSTAHRSRIVLAIVAAFTLWLARPVLAVPFDVIVPDEINVNTKQNYGVALGWWGWIVATTDPISKADMDSAVLTASIDDPNVSILKVELLNTMALAAKEARGELADPANSSVYPGLLQAGETFIGSFPGSFYGIALLYSTQSYEESGAELQASIAMGCDVVHYSTIVNFGDYPSGGWLGTVVTGQRRSSSCIPEPCTIGLLGLALGGLGALKRRRRKVGLN